MVEVTNLKMRIGMKVYLSLLYYLYRPTFWHRKTNYCRWGTGDNSVRVRPYVSSTWEYWRYGVGIVAEWPLYWWRCSASCVTWLCGRGHMIASLASNKEVAWRQIEVCGVDKFRSVANPRFHSRWRVMSVSAVWIFVNHRLVFHKLRTG